MATIAAISEATWYNLGLLAVLASLIVVGVIAYNNWIEAHEDVEPATESELLESFDAAKAAGELSTEEYERVRRRIQGEDAPTSHVSDPSQ